MANKNPNLENLKPFKKGESGNPKGSKPGVKHRGTIARKWLDLETKSQNPLSGIEEILSQEDIITLGQIKAARTDPSAYKVLMDSAYGTPKQDLKISGELKLGLDLANEDYK